MNEIWKEVKGFEGFYWVSNLGNVKTKRRRGSSGGLLKQLKDGKGYMRVGLRTPGVRVTKLVHRLVLDAFTEFSPDRPDVNHKNAVKDDNRLENLEWCTPMENTTHAIKHGLMDYSKSVHLGEKHGCSKLKEVQVVEIKKNLFTGSKTHKQIADEHGVSESTISMISCGKNWAWLDVGAVI